MPVIDDQLLEQLGFDSSDKASVLFKDYVDYTADEINDNGPDKTRELLINKNSPLYIELAYFITEVGMNIFHTEIDRFHKERDLTKIDLNTYYMVYGDELNPTYQQSAYLIANYINKQKNKNTKVLNKN